MTEPTELKTKESKTQECIDMEQRIKIAEEIKQLEARLKNLYKISRELGSVHGAVNGGKK